MQKIEELKREIEKWKYQAELGSNTTNRLSKQLEQKEQECERLKSQLTSLSYADEICALEIDLKHKTQECEELDNEIKQLRIENEKLKKLNDVSISHRICINDDLQQAEQKLKKIRKYCNYMTAFNNANKTNKGLDVKEVIQIIDEVE